MVQCAWEFGCSAEIEIGLLCQRHVEQVVNDFGFAPPETDSDRDSTPATDQSPQEDMAEQQEDMVEQQQDMGQFDEMNEPGVPEIEQQISTISAVRPSEAKLFARKMPGLLQRMLSVQVLCCVKALNLFIVTSEIHRKTRRTLNDSVTKRKLNSSSITLNSRKRPDDWLS